MYSGDGARDDDSDTDLKSHNRSQYVAVDVEKSLVLNDPFRDILSGSMGLSADGGGVVVVTETVPHSSERAMSGSHVAVSILFSSKDLCVATSVGTLTSANDRPPPPVVVVVVGCAARALFDSCSRRTCNWSHATVVMTTSNLNIVFLLVGASWESVQFGFDAGSEIGDGGAEGIILLGIA